MSQPKNNSLALAYAVHKRAKGKSLASTIPASEPKDEAGASSLTEAILRKRKVAKAEPPVDLEEIEDPTIDALDMLEDTDAVLEDAAPSKDLVSRIRERLKARRGV